MNAAAEEAGLSVGAFLRALALGDAGPGSRRRPTAAAKQLAQLLGQIGKIGGNINQIAKAIHTTRNLPSWSELAEIKEDIAQMRAAILKALGLWLSSANRAATGLSSAPIS